MSLVNQIRNSRRRSEGLPFELSLDSFDMKDIRGTDKAAKKDYNKEIREWAKDQTMGLRRSVSQRIRQDIGLSESIKEKVYYSRGAGREANRIGFSFLREGIYVHKGAGRGQGGLIGSTWTDSRGHKKRRDPQSAGKMGQANRPENKWFDTVIDRKLPQLADIVGNYSATLQVDATKLYLDKQ